MSWDIVIERQAVPLPDWLCDEEAANEIGPDGLMEVARDDPMAVLDEFGGFEKIVRFRRTLEGGDEK